MKQFRLLTAVMLVISLGLASRNDAFADRINIERVGVAQHDLSARTTSVQDLNGKNCALIKAFIDAPEVRFQGNIVKSLEHESGEYWVYMSDGAKQLRIIVPGNCPMQVDFPNTEVGGPLSSNVVYEIYCFFDEPSSGMSVSSFNRALSSRNALVKEGKYNEAIESLTILSDSLKNQGITGYLPTVESRIYYCKRRLALANTDLEENGQVTEGIVQIRKTIKKDNGLKVYLIGFMDSVGNIVAQPKYQRVLDYNNGVGWVKKDGRWGSLDKKGAIRVPFEYKVAKPIKSNHGVKWMEVSADSVRYGIVDYLTGQEILPMKYEETSQNESPDDNPLFALYNPSQKQSYFFNKEDCSLAFSIGKGQEINYYYDYGLFLTFRKTGTEKDLLGHKHVRGERGIVDSQGRQVLECENRIGFIANLENFWKDGDKDYIQIMCPPRKYWDDDYVPKYRIYSLNDREFLETNENRNLYTVVSGKWKDWIVVGRWHDYDSWTYYGLVNVKTGEKVFDPYDNMDIRPYNKSPRPVNDGKNLILECTCGKWYLFNNEGELIELPNNEESYQYEYFEQGHAILKRDGKYGFVDSNGKIVATPRFDEAKFLYEKGSWQVRNGDITIITDNLTDLYDAPSL